MTVVPVIIKALNCKLLHAYWKAARTMGICLQKMNLILTLSVHACSDKTVVDDVVMLGLFPNA